MLEKPRFGKAGAFFIQKVSYIFKMCDTFLSKKFFLTSAPLFLIFSLPTAVIVVDILPKIEYSRNIVHLAACVIIPVGITHFLY
jgi:hypothetical protein